MGRWGGEEEATKEGSIEVGGGGGGGGGGEQQQQPKERKRERERERERGEKKEEPACFHPPPTAPPCPLPCLTRVR